jgi:hypothetical protein
VVAAEQGLAEGEAWTRAQAAHAGRCHDLGRAGWRAQLWEPALVEVATDRPRRFTDPDTPPDQRKHGPRGAEEIAAEQAELDAVRAGLRSAGLRWVGQARRRRQVRESMDALLYAVAEVIATGQGKISHRRLAELAALGDSTVQRRLTDALTAGLLRLVATYRQDGQKCDIYGVGPAAQSLVETARQTEHRSCTPPLARPLGHADPTKLQARHLAERESFRSGTSKTSADTEIIEKDYPDQDHAVPALIRGRMRQRDWWAQLPPKARQERRAACRRRLDAMPADDRDQWVTEWLARRDLIDISVDHLLAGTALQADHDIVAAAPMTVHHGRNDPLWREGGTARPTPPPPAAPVQAELALDIAAAAAPTWTASSTIRPTSTDGRPGRRPVGRAGL